MFSTDTHGEESQKAPSPDAQDCCCSSGLQSASEILSSTLSIDETLPDEEMLYELADLFKVFADSTRIKILFALMQGEMSVASITEVVGVSQSAISHQLRLLKQARLVRFRRDGKQMLYALSDDHVYSMLAQGMTHICE